MKYNLALLFFSAITTKQEKEKKKIADDCVFNRKIRSSRVRFAKTEMCCVVVFTSPWIISLFDIMSNACALQGIPFEVTSFCSNF